MKFCLIFPSIPSLIDHLYLQVIVNNLQHLASVPPLSNQQPPSKKPGEGWGGRGARLPKVPVPLPSLPPNKSNGYSGMS